MKPKVEIKEIAEAPNLWELKDRFGVSENDTIISYGNAIYVKGKSMSADLLVHELLHCERQNFSQDSAARWWQKYMEDKEFRLQEELLACRAQYAYCCKVYKDRNRQTKILYALAGELASPRYGSLVSHLEAVKLLRA